MNRIDTDDCGRSLGIGHYSWREIRVNGIEKCSFRSDAFGNASRLPNNCVLCSRLQRTEYCVFVFFACSVFGACY